MALKRTRVPFYTKAEARKDKLAGDLFRAGRPDWAGDVLNEAWAIRRARTRAHLSRMASTGRGLFGRTAARGR